MGTPPAGSDESLSIWMDSSGSPDYESLRDDIDVDVAIVGAGITGVTAAYLLAREGASVALLEKGRIAMSETGHTTAHITEMIDGDCAEFIRNLGEKRASENTDAVRASIEQIRSLVTELRIDCGFHAVDGFLYGEKRKDRNHLKRQQEFLTRLGVNTEWMESVPLPFPTIGGLRFPNQYAFNARQYVLAIAEAARMHGALIYENSLVKELKSANRQQRPTITTEHGRVRSKSIVLATHVPIEDSGALWGRMRMTRSYVVAAPIESGLVPDSLFWDASDPYHYTRILETRKGLHLLVGGEDRGVGKKANDERRYEGLESYCRDRFGIEEFSHRWSGQINEPADGIPFIGRSPHRKSVWMASGYSGNGITYGTLAGMMLADATLGRDIRFARLFDPAREIGPAVVKRAKNKSASAAKPRLPRISYGDVGVKGAAKLLEGQGKVVMIGPRKCAISRSGGKIRMLDPTCTHLGCAVSWNDAEKSWDCSCHGSRFRVDGEVLNSPATEPLKPFKVPTRGKK